MENTTYEIGSNWMKKFLPIWSAQLFSLLGSSLVQFALIWWITQQTGSAAYLAMATFVAILPEVLIGPFAGALVDRLNRRYVMIVADGIIALLTLSLAILFALDLVQIWHIFVVMFLRSVGSVFHWPAMQSSTSLMVPEKHLSRVAGINQALRGSLNIVAPPLGALLMSVLKFYQVISVDVITAIIAITPLLFIRIPQPVRTDASVVLTPKVLMKDVIEGFKYMKNWKGLLYLTFLAAMLNFLLAPVDTLAPLMITQHFKAGVWQLSMIESAMGIGVVIGGLVLGVWGGFKNRILTSLTGVVGLGLGVVIFGVAPANMFWLAIVGMVVLGFMNPIANGPLQAIMQSKVAPEMQGRVMGTTGALCSAMMPLSMLVVAPVAQMLGLRVWYWVGGGLTILIGLGAFYIPAIMGLDRSQKDISTAEIAAD